MKIQLSDHFTLQRLLRFVMPSIIMMIFTSIYVVVDGLFVSNYVGKTPFASLNLIMPVLQMLGAVGFMIGTGGSAITAKTLGEGDKINACRYFSMMVYSAIAGGIILTILGQIFIRPISAALGAEGEMLEYCVLYGRILLISLTAYMLQNVLQSFLITAEKPKIGLAMTIAAGFTNMVGDFLFIAVFKWGLSGAAAATALSQIVGGICPLIYFIRKNSSLLQLVKTKMDWRMLFKACTNGCSELLTNISMSVVGMLYNLQLMRIAGENGVAAYGVIMYVAFIFAAIFIGFSIGCAPITAFNYGADNRNELKNIFKKSMAVVWITGVLLTVTAVSLSGILAGIFVGYDRELFEMTSVGLRFYSISFIISGFNIFGSAFFTSLGNGIISAVISFLRTLIFQIGAIFLLPLFLDIDGIWLAVTAAEILSAVVTAAFLIRKRKVYHYI